MTAPADVTQFVSTVPVKCNVFIFVGPPGCGKGTQATRLAERLNIPAISTGEMIRAQIRAGTPLGKIAMGVTMSGGLLSDDLVNEIVADRLANPDCRDGFILDGYPRTVDQAGYLAALLAERGFPQPTAIHIDVPNHLLIERTCMRRFCPQCGSIYNLSSHPPKVANHCDNCNTELGQRADDCEETVQNRIVAYERTASPIITFYKTADYHRIDGAASPDAVFTQIEAIASE